METNPSNHTNPIPYIVNEERIRSQAKRLERIEKEIVRTQRSVNNLRNQKQIHDLVMQLLDNRNFYNNIRAEQGLIVDMQV